MRSESVPAARLACVGLALVVVLGSLPFIWGGWFDVRWCAALASAWLNVVAVAVAAYVGSFGGSRSHNTPRLRQGMRVWRAEWWRASAQAARLHLRTIRWQPWAVLACSAQSLLAASIAWHPPLRWLQSAVSRHAVTSAPVVAVVVTGLLAFGTLVAELFYSTHATRGRAWTSLANVLRVALFITLAAMLCAALLAYMGLFLIWPVFAAAGISAAIALEFALRAALSWFAPPQSHTGEAGVPDSLIASLLRWNPSPLSRISAELRHQYGIDLRQNWVLQSVVRLLPMAVVTMVVCAWLLTGIVMLGPDQRAVYERFGAPVAVWQPGLHIALPWPFGNARVIDNGAVRQVMVSGSTDGKSAIPLTSTDTRSTDQSDRLWDVPHPGETSQVIAGSNGGRQNFQIVSADVRLDYRIGLSNDAARASLYRVADVAETVRSVANREVVRYLASHTLASLLETRQTVMADTIGRALRTQLDRIGSGVDIVAVVIESVHPPAGASAAYHGVQAAQIRAQASAAQARGLAAESLGDARQQAQAALSQADAQAADILSAARVQQTSFNADILASQAGGPAFTLEYYLRNLQKGLQNAHVTVIDDRLVEGNRATIDLRGYGAANDAAGARRVY
jgi:regulator of protease activity HflC (stomatin/prohibitin superfamily)